MKRILLLPICTALCGIIFADEPPKPITVTIKMKPAQMKYDLEKIHAAPGAQVTITLKNEDDLPHNLVLCRPKEDGSNDKGLEVAMQAWNMGEAGMKADWIPQNPRVIAHTKMVNPHESGTLTFTAPEQAGDYPFVCTFPGHAMVMNGMMKVNVPLPPIKNLHYRYYTAKQGESIKKLDDFAKLDSIEEGQLPSGKMDIAATQKKRGGDFAYEFEGALDCPKPGDYTFNMGSDDGSQLWIDGKEVVKIDGIHPPTFKNKKLKLTKGEHNIKIHYFQGGGGAEFYFAWSGPGFTNAWLSEQEPSHDSQKKDKENNEGLPLVITNEARIYRNFIAGSSPRGIAVGYPGGVNICWDADQMNVALVWQGAFMDAKRHWSGRGAGDQPPLGFGVAKLGQQHALGVLASQTDPWVPAYKKEQMRNLDYTFRGYELDAQRRPTFKYEYKGVTVTEFFEQVGDYKKENAAIQRTVTLSAKKPVENLYFLALTGALESKDELVGGKAYAGGAEVTAPVTKIAAIFPQSSGTKMLHTFIFDKTVKVTVVSNSIIIRNSVGHDEVLLPVVFKNGQAEFKINYAWNLK